MHRIPGLEILLDRISMERRTPLAYPFLGPSWHGTIYADSEPHARERVYIMKFAIEIGETEKHRLEYHFNQLFGSLLIKINERPVKQSVRLVNEPVLEVHVFVVGKYEHSEIRIEKERKPLLGHKNRLYVNNRLLKVFEGI